MMANKQLREVLVKDGRDGWEDEIQVEDGNVGRNLEFF